MPSNEPVYEEITRLFGESGLDRWKQWEGHLEAGAALLVLHVAPANAAVCERALAAFLARRQIAHKAMHFQSEREMLRSVDLLAGLNLEGIGAIWISFIGPCPADETWKKTCRETLVSLEQSRQKLLERIKVPIIIAGDHWLPEVFHKSAPHLLSMRSMLLGLYQPGEEHERPVQRSFTGIDPASDPDYAAAQAKQLAGRKDLLQQRIDLFLRAAVAYRLRGRWDLAESTLRTALAALQEAPPSDAANAKDRARVMAALGKILLDAGRRGEALAKAQEAEQICRRLVKQHPGVFEFALSGSLEVSAASLGKVGRFGEAVAKAEESIRLAEQLVKAKPGSFEKAWAESVYVLMHLLMRTGRNREALEKAREIERVFQGLAKTDPETFEIGRVRALTGLAETLHTVGQSQEAASKIREAVEILERLAKIKPSEFEAQLALCSILQARILGHLEDARPRGIKLLAGWFGRARRMAEAWESARRGVEIYDRLAKTLPQAYEEKLADALANLGERLYQLGRMEKAWKNLDAAVLLYERLAKVHPESMEPLLARTISLKRNCLYATHSPHTAAASAAAVKLLSRHFLQQPQMHASLMSYIVQDYMEDMKAAGREPDRKLLAPIIQVLNKVKKN
jgi:tetratricopeptide (TPR) repeat protein